MKKFLLLFSLINLLFVNVSSQTATPPSQVAAVFATSGQSGINGTRPLAGKTYSYTISMTAGKASFVTLRCTNGIFVSSGSTGHSVNAAGNFSVQVKWGTAGAGEVMAIDQNNYQASYRVNVENPYIGISGPETINFGDEVEYSITTNPNISISSLVWTHSPELIELSSPSNQIKYKVKATNNKPQTIINALQAVAKSDFGDLTAKKNITVEPVISIKPDNTLACPNGNIKFSLIGLSAGASVVWDSDSYFTLISGQGTSVATYKVNGSGSKIITATVTYGTIQYKVQSSAIWIGVEPTPNRIDGDLGSIGTARTNNEYGFWATGLSENRIEKYRWGYGTHTSSNYIETDINFAVLPSPSSGTSFSVTLSVKNPCGWSPTKTIVYPMNSGGKDKGPVGPLKNALTVDEDQPEIKSVKIYNLSGVLVYSDNAVNGSFDIKSTVLTDGVYIIEKFDGENRTSEKVMLKR